MWSTFVPSVRTGCAAGSGEPAKVPRTHARSAGRRQEASTCWRASGQLCGSPPPAPSVCCLPDVVTHCYSTFVRSSCVHTPVHFQIYENWLSALVVACACSTIGKSPCVHAPVRSNLVHVESGQEHAHTSLFQWGCSHEAASAHPSRNVFSCGLQRCSA